MTKIEWIEQNHRQLFIKIVFFLISRSRIYQRNGKVDTNLWQTDRNESNEFWCCDTGHVGMLKSWRLCYSQHNFNDALRAVQRMREHTWLRVVLFSIEFNVYRGRYLFYKLFFTVSSPHQSFQRTVSLTVTYLSNNRARRASDTI